MYCLINNIKERIKLSMDDACGYYPETMVISVKEVNKILDEELIKKLNELSEPEHDDNNDNNSPCCEEQNSKLESPEYCDGCGYIKQQCECEEQNEQIDIESLAKKIRKHPDIEAIIRRAEERAASLNDSEKYGNKDTEQQTKVYSDMILYEIADKLDILLDIIRNTK